MLASGAPLAIESKGVRHDRMEVAVKFKDGDGR